MTLTRIVRTGLSSTVSTPAIAAQWTMWVEPRASSCIASRSSTSACWNVKFGWSASVRARERVAMEVVGGDDLVLVDEAARERRADESGAAGDEDSLALKHDGECIDALLFGPKCELQSLLPLCIAVVGCGAGSAARTAAPARTDLKITVWPDGRGEGDAKTYTLRCAPAAGTLPKLATACSKLGRCRGPSGRFPRRRVHRAVRRPAAGARHRQFKGRSVWAMFSATNGCQISRAKRIAFLLPGFSHNSNA